MATSPPPQDSPKVPVQCVGCKRQRRVSGPRHGEPTNCPHCGFPEAVIESSVEDWPWPTQTIARVLVKTARGPVVPGNYFYAIRHGEEPSDEEETYIPISALLSDEVVEAVARRRWNARREAIVQSGSAEGPGLAWDDIKPNPRNGQDIRASEWNAARAFVADLQAAIEQVGGGS